MGLGSEFLFPMGLSMNGSRLPISLVILLFFYFEVLFIYQKQTNVLIDNKNMRKMRSLPHDVQIQSKETKKTFTKQ